MIKENKFDLEIFKKFIESIPRDITKIKPFAQHIINNSVNDEMLIYHFLFLQACAFGSTATWVSNGKWMKSGGLRDYWQPKEFSNRKSPVNPMMPMPDSLYQRVENIVNTLSGKIQAINDYCENCFYLLDPCELKTTNAIVYCDPPYNGTTQYGYNLDPYDVVLGVWSDIPIYISEGYKMDNCKRANLLSSGRTKGNINGKHQKQPCEEWLNVYT